MKMHVKKGDMVAVIAGEGRLRRTADGREVGWSGKVLAVFPRKQRVIVEGCNLVKKHIRKSQTNPKGAIVEKEGTIHISNVMLKEKWEARQKKRAPEKTETVKE
jgi:large subunit ribosomal protein L24